ELGHYVSCRDAVLEMIGKAFDVPRVEAKKLIISIGFGGSLSTWSSSRGVSLGRVSVDGHRRAPTTPVSLRAPASVKQSSVLADGETLGGQIPLFASTGFWETRHKDDLVTVVSNILKRLMMPFDGRDTVPPEPLNDLAFASSICNAVMAGLAGGNRLPTLDGDRGRDKILFSDGVLLNLPDLSQRKARPSDRSYDWVLWLLRFFTRAASGVDRYCEFLYLFGPGGSGKDVLLLILLRFLGREDDNYATMLPGSYVVVGGQSDKN
ncbi:unnamed protein product, partial [Effrenium voratum]